MHCTTSVCLYHSVLSTTGYSIASTIHAVHHITVLGMVVAMLGVLVYAHCYMTYEVLHQHGEILHTALELHSILRKHEPQHSTQY